MPSAGQRRLIIDEAHLLDHEQLGAVRMLTNHDMDSAITLIHNTSRGYPRAVNLAVQPLLTAYTDGKSIVDETSARARATVAEVTAE